MDLSLYYVEESLPAWVGPLMTSLEEYAQSHELPDGAVVFCPDATLCSPPPGGDALVGFVPATEGARSVREVAMSLGRALLPWAQRNAVLLAATPDGAAVIRDLLGLPAGRTAVLPLPAPVLPPLAARPLGDAVLTVGRLPAELIFGALRVLRLAGDSRPVILTADDASAWTRAGGIAGLHELMPGHDATAASDWREAVDQAAVIVLGEATSELGTELREALATGRPVIVPATPAQDAHLAAIGACALRYVPGDPVSLGAALEEALHGERSRALARAATEAVANESWTKPASVLCDALGRAIGPAAESAPVTVARSAVQPPAGDRLRVLFFSPLPAFGGHATIIRSFLHALCRHPLRPCVTVVAAADGGPESGLMDEVLAAGGPERARIVPMPAVNQALAEEAGTVDVVYSVWPHSLDPPPLPVPLVTTFYDMNWRHFDHLDPAERQRLDVQTPRWLEQAQIVCSSEFIAAELGRHFGADVGRIPIVPTPAPQVLPGPSAAEAERVRRRFALPERFLLCPAGHHPSKNYGALVAAGRLLRRRGTPITVIATGLRTDRLLGPDVIGLGYVGSADLRALFELCAGVVQPTLYEAGSFPMLEALSCGRPAAVSDIPAITEQIRRWDLRVETFDGRDPEACARAMYAVYSGARSGDAEHNARGVRGYTWDDFAGGYLEVLYTAAGRDAVTARAA